MENGIVKLTDEIYEEFDKEAQEYVNSLFKGVLLQEVYSLKFAKEMAKTAFIAGKAKEVYKNKLDKNKS